MTLQIVLVLSVLFAPAFAAAGDTPLWTWHEPATELYSPSFSPGGEELTLVRKRHIPDGHEAEELPAAELSRHDKEIEKDERYADPEVLILRIGTDAPLRVDWGWSPAFSPDGKQLVYAHQKKPISRFRVLAESMAGNDIRLFQRNTRRITTLAVPASAYLSDPLFAPDGARVVYSLGEATNGAWGGNVGVGRVSIAGTNNEILYPATKDFGLFHLIDLKQYAGDRLVALRSKPTSGGTHIADSYAYELLDLGPPVTTVFSWPADPGNRNPRAFGSTAGGQLLVFERGWRQLGAGTTSKPESSGNDDPGLVSPDGSTLVVGSASGLELQDRASRQSIRAFNTEGQIQGVAWSPDSRRLVVVSSHYAAEGEVFSHDEIAVFER